MDLSWRIVETADGPLGIVASPRGLRAVYLPCETRAAVTRRIRQEHPGAAEDPALLPDLVADLQRYFEGDTVDFDVRIDWSDCTNFEADVWRACQRIRYGHTRSYKDLAERLGRPNGARAVGMAMSHNPCPIVVPCHRVVKSDGSLGGYSGPGGTDYKQHLLELEEQAVALKS